MPARGDVLVFGGDGWEPRAPAAVIASGGGGNGEQGPMGPQGPAGTDASLPVGVIVMWSGTLATKPSGWELCDGQGGRPDLRDRFILGWSDGVNPGGTGGAATHAHSDHAALAHSGATVGNHAVTQPSAHSNHAVTQPADHSALTNNHAGAAVGTSAAGSAHTHTQGAVTQPSAHAVTQPSAHSAHAALATHQHELPFSKASGATGQLKMLAQSIFGSGTSRAPESISAAPTANVVAATVALSEAKTAGTPDAHSAHAGTAVDAHAGTAVANPANESVHTHAAGTITQPTGHGAISAHASTAVDAHSAHSGAGVDAHTVGQASSHAAQSHATADHTPVYYKLALIIKT